MYGNEPCSIESYPPLPLGGERKLGWKLKIKRVTLCAIERSGECRWKSASSAGGWHAHDTCLSPLPLPHPPFHGPGPAAATCSANICSVALPLCESKHPYLLLVRRSMRPPTLHLPLPLLLLLLPPSPFSVFSLKFGAAPPPGAGPLFSSPPRPRTRKD